MTQRILVRPSISSGYTCRESTVARQSSLVRAECRVCVRAHIHKTNIAMYTTLSATVFGLLVASALCLPQVSQTSRHHPREPVPPLTGTPPAPVGATCLNCICEFGCGITRPYWQDAGQPFVPGDTLDNPRLFDRCVSDLECLTRTVQGYMARFYQDCNSDGAVDCHDFARMHMLGGYDCNDTLPAYYERQVEQCLARHKLAATAG